MQIENMDDDFLATCVDEFIKRAIRCARVFEQFNGETVRVNITAAQSYHDANYKISHDVQLGDSYGKQYSANSTNNAIRGMRDAAHRLIEDRQAPPTEVCALIEAPPPPEVVLLSNNDDELATDVAVEDAQFTEVHGDPLGEADDNTTE